MKIKKFQPSRNQSDGDYELKVKCASQNKFESSQKLQVNKKRHSVFIQTDKSIYKPGDNVKFRVFLLDEETRPFNASKVQIYISDGGNNRLKQFDDARFVQGVHQNELQLSDSPVLGSWKINVKVNKQKEVSKEFEVAEYVLPKFELTIDTSPDASYKDDKIVATVKAKYTFGKIAKGNATITAKGSRTVTKSIEVNGKKNVEFELKELGISKSLAESTVQLFATFTEELSGKVQNATAKVQIHVTPHKIRFEKSGDKFKPGLPFNVTALLNFHEKNVPVTDKSAPVIFKITFFHNIVKKCPSPSSVSYHHQNDYESVDDDSDNDCGYETSYEESKEIFAINGLAVLTIDIPSITKRINVEVNFSIKLLEP